MPEGSYRRHGDPTVYRENRATTREGAPYDYLAFHDLHDNPIRLKVSTLAGESAARLFIMTPGHSVPAASVHFGVDQGCELIAGIARWMADGNLISNDDGTLGPHQPEVEYALARIQDLALFLRDNTRWGPTRDQPDE